MRWQPGTSAPLGCTMLRFSPALNSRMMSGPPARMAAQIWSFSFLCGGRDCVRNGLLWPLHISTCTPPPGTVCTEYCGSRLQGRKCAWKAPASNTLGLTKACLAGLGWTVKVGDSVDARPWLWLEAVLLWLRLGCPPTRSQAVSQAQPLADFILLRSIPLPSH